MVSAGEQVGTKCSILFTHITGLWLYESHSWCLGHWAPISFENRKTHDVYALKKRKCCEGMQYNWERIVAFIKKMMFEL